MYNFVKLIFQHCDVHPKHFQMLFSSNNSDSEWISHVGTFETTATKKQHQQKQRCTLSMCASFRQRHALDSLFPKRKFKTYNNKLIFTYFKEWKRVFVCVHRRERQSAECAPPFERFTGKPSQSMRMQLADWNKEQPATVDWSNICINISNSLKWYL